MHVKIQFHSGMMNVQRLVSVKNKALNKVKRIMNSGELIEYKKASKL